MMKNKVFVLLASVFVAVLGVATPQDMINQVVIYQRSQNTANTTLALSVFAEGATFNAPLGSNSYVGKTAIAGFFNSFFGTYTQIKETVSSPLVINSNVVAYTKIFQAVGFNNNVPTTVVTWFKFNTSTVPPLVYEWNGVFGKTFQFTNTTTPTTSNATGPATDQDMINQVIIYQHSQNTLNVSEAVSVFAEGATANAPLGSNSYVGKAAISAFYTGLFGVVQSLKETVSSPLVINENVVAYTKVFQAPGFNNNTVTPVVTWFIFNRSTVPPLCTEWNAVFGTAYAFPNVTTPTPTPTPPTPTPTSRPSSSGSIVVASVLVILFAQLAILF